MARETSPGLKILWFWTLGTAAVLVTTVVRTRLRDMEQLMNAEQQSPPNLLPQPQQHPENTIPGDSIILDSLPPPNDAIGEEMKMFSSAGWLDDFMVDVNIVAKGKDKGHAIIPKHLEAGYGRIITSIIQSDDIAFESYVSLLLPRLMDPQLYQALILGNQKFFEDSRNAGSCNLLQVTSGHKNTILHIAARCGGINITEKIIGFFPGLLHQTNSKGDSPLHVAARLGRLEMIQLLVNCAKLVEVEVGKELLRMENLDKDTALHVAIRNGHFEVVNLLIAEDPELTLIMNSLGESSLFLAVDRKFYKIAQHIIETVPSYCHGGSCAMNVLHAAIIRADNRFVLMVAMASIMNLCSIALTMFINQLLPAAFMLSSLNFGQYCSFSYIGADFLQEVLKRHPSAIKEADLYGWIPLHYAAYLGDAEVVELFLQFDSSLAYVKDKGGMAALHLSAKAGHVNVAQKLTAICPDTSELLDNHYRTALHVAAENGKRSVVSFFLMEQVYWDLMNEQDEVGNTPLHSAAVQGHSEILLLLANDPRLDKGALNKAGFTASDIIMSSPLFKQHEKRQILCMLKARGVLRSLGQACTIVKTEAETQDKHQQTERTDPIGISGNEERSKEDWNGCGP